VRVGDTFESVMAGCVQNVFDRDSGGAGGSIV